MAKQPPRPGKGRPPGRIGRAGTGPGPGYRPSGRGSGTSHTGPGGGTSGGNCCPMVAALQSVKRGKFRLARRYAAMSVRLLAARYVRMDVKARLGVIG